MKKIPRSLMVYWLLSFAIKYCDTAVSVDALMLQHCVNCDKQDIICGPFKFRFWMMSVFGSGIAVLQVTWCNYAAYVCFQTVLRYSYPLWPIHLKKIHALWIDHFEVVPLSFDICLDALWPPAWYGLLDWVGSLDFWLYCSLSCESRSHPAILGRCFSPIGWLLAWAKEMSGMGFQTFILVHAVWICNFHLAISGCGMVMILKRIIDLGQLMDA